MARQNIINQPAGGTAGEALHERLGDPSWTTFRCAVAFVKASGVKHLAPYLDTFASRSGVDVRITVGVSGQVSSLEGMQDLWRLIDGRGQLYIFNEGLLNSIFHPKLFFFRNSENASVIAGSNNLTAGGLYTNQEFATITDFDISHPPDHNAVQAIEAALDSWQTPSPSCLSADTDLLKKLHLGGYLPSELSERVAQREKSAKLAPAKAPGTKIFDLARSVSGAPNTLPFPAGLPDRPFGPVDQVFTTGSSETTPSDKTNLGHSVLLMEVRPHHNGEVFLSYRALKDDPEFFGHPFTGWSSPTAAKAYPMADPDPLVEIIVYDKPGSVIARKINHELNMVDYERKSEIRITLPDRMQDKIPEFSLLIMTKSPNSTLDYRLEFVPPDSQRKREMEVHLINTLSAGGRGVGRKYGWT